MKWPVELTDPLTLVRTTETDAEWRERRRQINNAVLAMLQKRRRITYRPSRWRRFWAWVLRRPLTLDWKIRTKVRSLESDKDV